LVASLFRETVVVMTTDPEAADRKGLENTSLDAQRQSALGGTPLQPGAEGKRHLPEQSGQNGRFRAMSKMLALPFGSAPLASEEGCRFLQRRLAFFSLTMLLMGSFAFLATHAIALHVGGGFRWADFGDDESLSQLVSVLTPFGTWLLVRRGSRSINHLFVLDGFGTLIILVAYALTIHRSAAQIPARAPLLMMVITMLTMTWRAITVPSTPGHTVGVTGACAVPVLALTYHVGLRQPTSGWMSPVLDTAFMGVWVVLCLAICGTASGIIYGLRVQVAQAQQLGQYVLDELIGEGGMGIVYKARHAMLRRPTAVKLVLPERAGSAAVERFEREVQLTAMLTHPNTVNIYDYGRTADGIVYYAMEYLDGIDLEKLVGHFGPQPSGRVVYILEQIAGALAEAHGVGLVHRDIKPANVILCNRGGLPDVAKVVDFGLVKDIRVTAGKSPTLTRTDAIIGTPHYLAPEVMLTPEAIDGRSDLYALGAVGYFLLTGQPVFSGSSVIDICVKHVQSIPVLPSARLGAPIHSGLEALILRCLAKRPDERPQTADAFLSELTAAAVPRWTRAEAVTWWKQHAGDLSRSKPAPTCPQRTSNGLKTVVVDFIGRVRSTL
jgi:eukaryotic-like serine/threonine-protein kinase